MYDNPNYWCHILQCVVFDTMLENHMTFNTENIKIMERSLFSAMFFCEVNYANKRLTSNELCSLRKIYETYLKESNTTVDLLGEFFFCETT